MAKMQVVSYSYTCDVCGTTIPDTDGDDANRKLSWEGTAYVLDVCSAHGSELQEVLGKLKEFVDAGHRSGGRRGRRAVAAAASTSARAPRGRRAAATTTSSGAAPKRGDLGAIRSWARANGHKVSERGRIPSALLQAYDSAQSAPPPEPVAEPAPPSAAKKSAPRKRAPRKAAATAAS